MRRLRQLVSIPALTLVLVAITGCGQRTPAPPASSPDAASTPAPSGERIVNVYNWADYIDPEVIADFEKTSGIKVNYDTYDSQEMLETKLMVTWGTNVGLARTRAKDAGRDVDFRYVIPQEGTVQWFDTLAIPTDAPHPDEAHAFIDFLMRADVAARNADYVGQATVNAAAMPMIDAALRNDPGIYPPAEVLARLVPLRARTPEESRLESSAWTSFRRGP